jgi:thiol-disulfide isomerase/thioredoxin
MDTIFNPKLGPFILFVNVFFAISVIAETSYEEKTKDAIIGDIRKFIFSQDINILPKPLIIDADENIIELGYENKISIINFWATWCAPCKKEMPSLNNLAQKLKGIDFRVITIASGRNSKEAIDTFFLNNNLKNLTKYRDPKGKLAINYGITALPTTVLIGPSGEEIGRILGDIDWDTKNMKGFLEKLVKSM